MNLDWIKDIGWVGTTLVALGGLAATVWTSRRSSDVQLEIQDKQLEESRRVLEWQERRAAYAHFLTQIQEYVDKVTTQKQIDTIVENAAGEIAARSVAGSGLDEAETARVAKRVLADVHDQMQEDVQILTMRDEWSLHTQVQDAANQARMIASPPVQEGIDLLMLAVAKDKIYAAVNEGQLTEFMAVVEGGKRRLNMLMNRDLVSE